jgi:hypothetical protein
LQERRADFSAFVVPFSCLCRTSKNREAAQLFRQRQRDHIKSLEQQVEQLSLQNQQFISQSDQLTTENKLIRQQLYVLREFISQAMSFAFSNIPSSLLYQQLQALSSQAAANGGASAPPPSLLQAVSSMSN